MKETWSLGEQGENFIKGPCSMACLQAPGYSRVSQAHSRILSFPPLPCPPSLLLPSLPSSLPLLFLVFMRQKSLMSPRLASHLYVVELEFLILYLPSTGVTDTPYSIQFSCMSLRHYISRSQPVG